jgi:glutamine amidotransferase/cyclase
MPVVHLLDYVAGNVRSLVNAVEKLGYQVEWIKSPADVSKAEVSVTVRSRRERQELTLLSRNSYCLESGILVTASPS